MNLSELYGKKVVIEAIDKQVFRGTVGDYVEPEDNENNKESIVLDAIGHPNPIELYESDIKAVYEMK